MKLIMSILIWLLNHAWVIALFIVIAYFALARYQKQAIREQPKDPKFPAGVLLVLLPLILIFSFFSRYVTIPLTYYFGEESVGHVVADEMIPELHNEQQVYRHHVVFHDTEEELIETSFKTSDFNIYPLSNRVVYPDVGETFNLRYMKYIPSEFIIVEE